METEPMKKLIALCPYLGKLENLRESIERMEIAYKMNGGTLTNDHIQNAINYLLDLDKNKQ